MKEEKKEHSFSVKEAFLNWFGLFLVIVAAMALYFVVTRFKMILHVFGVFLTLVKPVIYGCVIAYLVNPLYKFFLRLLHRIFIKSEDAIKKRTLSLLNGIAITLGVISGILIIIVLGWLILPSLINSVISMADAFPARADGFYQRLTVWLKNNPYLMDQMQKALLQATEYADAKMNTEFMPWLQKELLPHVNNYAVQLANGLMGILNVFYNLFIGIIVAIYLLAGKNTYLAQAKKLTYGLFRRDHADVLIHYLRLANDMFSGFITGKIVDSTIIGIICFVVMSILHLPYTVLVSVIVGVTNVIPVFGPYIGAVPSILLILLVNPIQALYFLILIVILQQLDGNVIGPAILGESTGLSAFWVLFSILLFGGIWGIAGMLVGVPLFAVIYELIRDFINARLRNKQLATETEHYKNLKEILSTEEGIVYIAYTKEELQGKKKKKDEPTALMQALYKVRGNAAALAVKKQEQKDEAPKE